MAIATLATNRALETVMTKAIPLAYVALSRGLLTNRANGHRFISTVSQPRLMPNNQSPSTIKQSYSPISPTSAAFRNVSRQFSTDHHLDPYERFTRRTGVNWGIRLVPQQEAFVIERFGKFHKVLEAGLHVMVPFVDRISYIHSLKEQTFEIPEQPAITTDNVSIRVNGVLFVKVIDAQKASYGHDNVMYAVTQLADTVMRNAIGKMSLDITFKERETLNANIVEAINDVASQWRLICTRYGIRDIILPPGIRDNMVKESTLPAPVGDPSSMAASVIGDAHDENNFQESSKLIDSATKIIALYKNLIEDAYDEESSKRVDSATQMIALYKNLIGDAHDKNTFQERSKLIDSATEKIALYKNLIGDEQDEESSKLIDSATQIIALYKNHIGDAHDKNTFQERSKLIDSGTEMIALYKNLIGDEQDEESSKLIDSVTQMIALYKNYIGDAQGKNTFQERSKLIDSATKIIALYKNLIGDEQDEESSKLIDSATQIIALYKNYIGDVQGKNIFQERSKLIDSATKIIALYKNLIGDEQDEESSKLIDSATQMIALYKNHIGDTHDKNTFQERFKLFDEKIALYKNLIGDAHDEENSKLIDSATQIIALYKNYIVDAHGKKTFQEKIDSATQIIALYKNLKGEAHEQINSATEKIAQYKNLIGDAHDKNPFQGISKPIDSGTQILEAEVIDEKSSSSLKRPEKN